MDNKPKDLEKLIELYYAVKNFLTHDNEVSYDTLEAIFYEVTEKYDRLEKPTDNSKG